MTENELWGHLQVAWLAGAGRRLRRADRERPWLLDTVLALALFLASGLPDLLQGGAHHEGGGTSTVNLFLLQAGLIVPLRWRRRAPFAVFVVIAAVFLLQWSVDVGLHSDVALFVALYSLARHGAPRYLGWACGITVAALALVAVRVSTRVDVFAALFFLCSAATAAVALGLGIRLGWAYLVALRDRAARLEVERDQRSRLAAAAERARIAREMHDIIGHNLSVIIGLADGGARAADLTPERSKQALQLISGTGRQALGELRRMLAVLHEERGQGGENAQDTPEAPELSPQPRVADLDALCERVRAAGPEVVYRTVGEPEALDPGVQLTVYRIVQESLTNTLKHAGTHTRARLTVSAESDQLHVRVEDTGPASGPRQTAHHPPTGLGEQGHGIVGMRERAALYGGTITAGPRPGGGWSVDAVLPLAPVPAPPRPLTGSAP